MRDRASICSLNDKERIRLIASETISIGLDTAPSHDVYERALDHHERQHEPDQHAIGAFELADEIVRRRDDQDLPSLSRSPSGIWLNSATYSAPSGSSLKVNRSGLPAACRRNSFDNLRIVCVRPVGHLQSAIDELWTALSAPGEPRSLPCSSAMTVMLLGLALCRASSSESPPKRDVCRCDADEVLLHQDRITQRNHRVTGVRVYERVGDDKRQALARQLILRHRRAQIVVGGANRIAAEGCGPRLVEGAVTLPVGAGRKSSMKLMCHLALAGILGSLRRRSSSTRVTTR